VEEQGRLMVGIKKPMIDEKFIENLALEAVTENLRRNDWSPQLAETHNQKGFDLTALKGDKLVKIEVKGRSILDYSGTKNDSENQRKDPQRFFNFSKSQYEIGDFFVPVFVAPSIRKCVVVPRRDFDRFATSKFTPYRIAFSMDSNLEVRKIKRWRDGRTEDISKFIEGWHLLDE
jgi:hypothetical protein